MNARDALAAVSGLKPKVVDEIWEKVKANGKALDSCAGPHDFVAIDPEKKIGVRYRCAKCGGETESSQALWYALGLKHSGGY
jgi:hypothetical protein